MDTLTVKGVAFRLRGLRPESRVYLETKLKRARKRDRERWSLVHAVLRAILPASYRRVPIESLVAGRTLVVGCAGGIESMGLGAVGIDIDRDALRIAADLRSHAVEAAAPLLAASGADLPFPDGHFDSVLSDNVIEHIPDALIPRHLRETRRVLKPGGRYVFTTPNRLFEDPPHEGHVALHSYAEWEALARDAGYAEVLTPRRRSGLLGDLSYKKAREARAAAGGMRLGLSHRGVRMVTLVAFR